MAANTSGMTGDQRRAQLMSLALGLAEEHGFQKVSSEMLSAAAECSGGLVRFYWKNEALTAAIVQAAIDAECLPVVAQGLAVRHPVALAASPELRQRVANALVSL